jgi:hypothetical protein
MKFIKNLALFVAAIFVVRVLVTGVGILFSVIPMISDLPPSEMGRRTTYVILAAYFFTIVTLLVITSLSLFNQATNKDAFKINSVVMIFALTTCGSHLLLALLWNPNNSLLVQFSQSFIWVPVLTIFAVSTSFLIAKSQRLS